MDIWTGFANSLAVVFLVAREEFMKKKLGRTLQKIIVKTEQRWLSQIVSYKKDTAI